MRRFGTLRRVRTMLQAVPSGTNLGHHLRSAVTHAARFSAAICRNQLDSGFQLMKIWVTNLRSRMPTSAWATVGKPCEGCPPQLAWIACERRRTSHCWWTSDGGHARSRSGGCGIRVVHSSRAFRALQPSSRCLGFAHVSAPTSKEYAHSVLSLQILPQACRPGRHQGR